MNVASESTCILAPQTQEPQGNMLRLEITNSAQDVTRVRVRTYHPSLAGNELFDVDGITGTPTVVVRQVFEIDRPIRMVVEALDGNVLFDSKLVNACGEFAQPNPVDPSQLAVTMTTNCFADSQYLELRMHNLSSETERVQLLNYTGADGLGISYLDLAPGFEQPSAMYFALGEMGRNVIEDMTGTVLYDSGWRTPCVPPGVTVDLHTWCISGSQMTQLQVAGATVDSPITVESWRDGAKVAEDVLTTNDFVVQDVPFNSVVHFVVHSWAEGPWTSPATVSYGQEAEQCGLVYEPTVELAVDLVQRCTGGNRWTDLTATVEDAPVYVTQLVVTVDDAIDSGGFLLAPSDAMTFYTPVGSVVRFQLISMLGESLYDSGEQIVEPMDGCPAPAQEEPTPTTQPTDPSDPPVVDTPEAAAEPLPTPTTPIEVGPPVRELPATGGGRTVTAVIASLITLVGFGLTALGRRTAN